MLEKLLNIGRKIIPRKLFKLGQPIYHFFLSLSGNIIYRFPGRKLICVGITGTNGKSTTAELVNSVLKSGGYRTGMISTVAFEINRKRTENKTSRTTLGRWQTSKMLREMVKEGCTHAVIEVASEGIVQFRTWGIPFDVSVFTNLSPEHLNTHGNITNYRNTKGKLFENTVSSKKKKGVSKIGIINMDDREAKYFAAFPYQKLFEYGVNKGQVRAKNITQDSKLSFSIDHDNKSYFIQSDLIGKFNVYNILAAWCVGFSQGIDPRKIKWGIEEVKQVKGRMEKVAEKNGVKYYIDYAMTPDSYEMLFNEMKDIAKGKVITVFGAAGDRDKGKRPQIGEVAAKNADFTILTNDEPYSEDPNKIIEDIKVGFKKTKKKNYKVIKDRKKAFRKAIKMAKSGDVVVVPGMGHEVFRNIGGDKKVPWNEAKIIKDLVEK